MHHPSSSIDPKSGYCSATKTFRSLRGNTHLPPETTALSITDYVFACLRTNHHFSLSSTVLIDAATHLSLSYAEFLRRIDSLSSSLSHSLSPGHVALILSPPTLHVPVLYLSLLSLGVIISPANPISTQSELTHLLQLASPSVIFAVSSISSKLTSSTVPVILLDSPEFDSMLTGRVISCPPPRASVSQSDSAVIMYSSGTTGRVKGVELTHRNFIVSIGGSHYSKVKALEEKAGGAVWLCILPLFHVFGFCTMLRAVAMAETVVLMGRFNMEKMLEAVKRYRVKYMPVSPALLVAMEKSESGKKYDLRSLQIVGCGGAPLGREVAERFKAGYANVEISQVGL